MKRRIALATGAVASLSLVLAGCSSGSDDATSEESSDSGNSGGESGEVVELEFWHGYTEADGEVLDQLVADFNESQEGVQITTSTKPWATILDTALPALTAGEGPQILALPAENIPTYASRGALSSLEDFYASADSGADTLNEQAVSTGLADGERYAAPLSFTPLTMFYNQALFDEAGVEVPTDWDEWVEVATALTVDENGDGTPEQYGLALQDNATVGNGVWMSLLKSGGGDVVTEDGEVVVNSQENIDTLEFWTSAVADNSISPTGLTGVDGDELFSSGKAAMTFAGPWMATIADSSGIEWGIAAIPAGPDGTKASALAVDMTVTSQASAEEQAAAEEFFTWFYQPENMVTWSLGSGWPPLTTNVDASEVSENPVVAALTEQSQYGVALLPGVIPQADILTELDTAVQKAMAGQGDIAELLETAQAEMEATLAQ